MSGISGVTGKMKPEVSAQRTGWRDGLEGRGRGRGRTSRFLYKHAV